MKLSSPALMPTIPTCRPWTRRLADALRARVRAARRSLHHASPLRGLDAHALADIGVHASEIDSIEGEARGPGTLVTRRRIVSASPTTAA